MQMLPVEASQACPRSLPLSVGVRGHMDNAGLWLLGPAWPPQALNSAFKNGHLSTASSTCSLSPTSSGSRFRSALLPLGPDLHARCSTSGDPCSGVTAAPNQPNLLPTPGLSAHAAHPLAELTSLNYIFKNCTQSEHRDFVGNYKFRQNVDCVPGVVLLRELQKRPNLSFV